MKLTVVIVCWNGLNNLKILIPTLRNQTFKDFEIIISDNGSIDGTEEWLKKEKLNFIKITKNIGFSGGVNTALKKVKTEYVAIINDDTKLESDVLEKLLNCIENNKNIGSVQPTILNWDGKTIQSNGLILTYGSFIAEKNKGKKFIKYRTDTKPEEVWGTQPCCAIYRFDIIKKIGFFDESYNPAYFEDADLAFSIKKQRYKNFCIKDTIIYHKGGNTTKKMGYAARISFQRNRYRFLKKQGDAKMWIKTILWFPFVTGFYLFKKPEKAYFQATLEFLLGKL